MLALFNTFQIIILSWNWVDYTISIGMMSKSSNIWSRDSTSDLSKFLTSKSYVPDDISLPKTSLVKTEEPDTNYLLSKLSDEDLLRLLNEQPKKDEYDLNDALKLGLTSKTAWDMVDMKQNKLPSLPFNNYNSEKQNNHRFQKAFPKNQASEIPLFRLDYKPVKAFNFKEDMDPKYLADQKLNNLLYSRPQEQMLGDDNKKELLFDILVAQLKTLCCKKSKPKTNIDNKKHNFRSLFDEIFARNLPKQKNSLGSTTLDTNNEYLFLVLNDEIKSSSNEELIPVDPESLDQNSSVVLLGPIITPLSDLQLKLVMNRISNELSKPEYLPVLQQLSNGSLSENNTRLVKSLISGPETRRYIKPHRCNHQSKLARVYGGPKWIICTGYLNINTPSLYDK